MDPVSEKSTEQSSSASLSEKSTEQSSSASLSESDNGSYEELLFQLETPSKLKTTMAEKAIGATGNRMKLHILERIGVMAGVRSSTHCRSSAELLCDCSVNDDGFRDSIGGEVQSKHMSWTPERTVVRLW